jgi:hypothetical protein
MAWVSFLYHACKGLWRVWYIAAVVWDCLLEQVIENASRMGRLHSMTHCLIAMQFFEKNKRKSHYLSSK